MKLVALSVLRYFAVIFWSCVALCLGFIWIKTLEQHHLNALFFVLIALAVLAALFLLGGLEIAYTNLRDKDIEQIDEDLRPLLNSMREDEEVVYEGREWLGVILVVTLALLCEMQPLYQPQWLLHRIDEKVWKLIFSLLFTTLPAVWLAQSPAKKLAIVNSQLFFRRARYIWPLVKAAGLGAKFLGLSAISETLFSPTFESWSATRAVLPPSESAFYMTSLKRYGSAFHDLSEHVTISPDGSAETLQEGTVYVVSPDRTRFTRRLYMDSAFISGSLELLEVFHIPPPPEKLEHLEAQIGLCNATNLPAGYKRASPTIYNIVEVFDPKRSNEVTYSVVSPGALAGKKPGFSTVLRYRMQTKWAPGTFAVAVNATDSYRLGGDIPVRIFNFNLSFSANAPRRFANVRPSVTVAGQELAEEQGKIECNLNSTNTRELGARVRLPLVGGSYGIGWEIWRA